MSTSVFISLPFFLFLSLFFLASFLSSGSFPAMAPRRSSSKLGLKTAMTSLREVVAIASTNSSPEIDDRLSFPAVFKRPARVSKRQRLEAGLARARAAILRAGSGPESLQNLKDSDFSLSPEIYRNPAGFLRSYEEMEKRFKVFVYEEGEPPLAHHGPCKNIYAIEGRFIDELELGGSPFLTRDPNQAHVFFLPFSVTMMVSFLYRPLTYDLSPLLSYVADYVQVVSTKHPFWNASGGADHFMLSCHDWGPHVTRAHPLLYNSSIRVLCNANTSEGFDPRKDVSLPEINVRTGRHSPKPHASSLPESSAPRPVLAFFAGGVHGPIRPLLLHHWQNRGDPEVRVYEYLPYGLDYQQMMQRSKFCLCPSGYEVASPRVVEAIHAGCVPVLVSDHYVPPFSDVLRWEAFSVRVEVAQIPDVKTVLRSIPEDEYRRLRDGVRAVRRHFALNQPAKRLDVFHMVLHSVWLRRLNIRLG
ncbi:probable glycosyltransferase At5g25310 [Nymphaea colorata]|nr:probable glycosyltransferase At5g25310 [Nymphaea colorata]